MAVEPSGVSLRRLRRALELCMEAEQAVGTGDWPRANELAGALQCATHALFNGVDLAKLDEVTAASIRSLRDRLTHLSLTVAAERDDVAPAVRSARTRRRMSAAYTPTA